MSLKLTIDLIRARTVAQTFSRGQSYYKNEAIFDTVQRGNQIEGFSEASSQPEPYHVRATLGEAGIVDASCTCQYDYGGDCKHIVALLLTYLNNPEKFEQHTPVAETLASRDKNDLIALIHKMIERYPDLQSLVDLPVPGRSGRKMPVDTAVFRKQMRHALRNYGGWGDRTAELAVQSIIETAGEFAEKGDWRSASAIYRTVLEECTSDDEYPVTEDEGEFGEAVNETVDKLAACLEQREIADDDSERKAILDALLSAYVWDSDMGGYGIAEDAPDNILRYARQSDLAALREKLTAAQKRKSASHHYGEWAVRAYAAFLIELDALDNTDPEVTLARLRDEGMYSLLVRKLLEMKRVDEALAVVEQDIEDAYGKLAELPHLIAAGRADDAIRIARQILKTKYDSQVAGWLLEQYKARNDWEAYVELQRQEMLANPAEHNYVLLEQAAEKVGRWQTIRPEILDWLTRKKHFDVLTKVYLHDQEWDAAWDMLDQYRANQGLRNTWDYVQLDLEVAKRSQTARPLKAIPVYVKYARWHISQKDRRQYQIAAEFLSTVRDLYLQRGDEAAWQKLISGIRAEFPNLRALHDEIKKAGL